MGVFERIWVVGAVSAALLAAAPACKRVTEALQGKAAPATSAAPERHPASEAQAQSIAARLLAVVRQPSGPTAGLFDWDALLERALGPDKPEGSASAAFGNQAETPFFAEIRAALAAGGSYKLLLNRLHGGERRVKFRLLHANGGFNYHDYVIEARDGKPRIIDVEVLLSGELLSATTRRVLLPLVAQQSRSILERLTQGESEYVKNLSSIQRIVQLADSDPQGAMAVHDSLPAALKRDKNVMLLRLRLAEKLGEAQYLTAMEDFRRTFPKDASIDAVSLDFHTLRKEYDQALAALARVEAKEGRDPYLDVLRANYLLLEEDAPAAKRAAEAALAAEPDLDQARVPVFLACVQSEDFTAASAAWRAVEAAGLDNAELRASPAYQALAASPEFKRQAKADEQRQKAVTAGSR